MGEEKVLRELRNQAKPLLIEVNEARVRVLWVTL